MSFPARTRPSVRRAAAVVALAASTAGLGVALATASPASAATGCSDVDVLFARGTGEAQGLGTVGAPFTSAVASSLQGRTVTTYAVVYDANTAQTSAAPGSTDLVNHLTSVAASCPGTQFILGGYSQGATVVDKALGIQTGSGTGTAIPTALSGRVSAVVAFGNPLGIQNQTIATASPTYGARSKDYCNTGDPVCGNGSNTAAHLQYASNGSAAAGGRFAAGLVTATAPPATTTPPTTTPPVTSAPPVTTAPPTSTTPTPTAQCVRASTTDQVAAGRATSAFGRAYALGTRDSLGQVSRFNIVSLRQNSTTNWSEVTSC